MYAEKLSNRALALPLSPARSFRCSGDVGSGLCTWYAEGGTVTRDDSTPLNAAVPHAMRLGPAAVATNAGAPPSQIANALLICCASSPALIWQVHF